MRTSNSAAHSAVIQFSSQILTLASFVILTPIYLRNWEQKEYQVWILLITIIQIIENFDLGTVVASLNKLTAASNNSEQALNSTVRKVSRGLWSIDLYIGSLFIFLASIFLFTYSKYELGATCVILILNSITNHWFGLTVNISRVQGDQRKSFLFAGVNAFLQSCMWALGPFLHKSMLFSALLGLFFCLFFLIFSLFNLLSREIRHEIIKVISRFPYPRTLISSLHQTNFPFFFNTLVSLISVHGYVIIANFYTTSSIFVGYTVLKTISRVLISTSVALGNSYWSVIIDLKSKRIPINRTVSSLFRLTSISVGIESLCILLFTQTFIQKWSAGRIELNWTVLGLLLLHASISAFNYSLRYVFFGIDEEKFIAKCALLVLAIGLGFSIGLGFLFGIIGIVTAQILTELIFLCIAGRRLISYLRLS